MKRLNRSHALTAIVATVASGAVVGGVAIATQESTTIEACVNQAGTPRLVADADACRPSETHVFWNKVGPQGLQGEPGKDGVDGVDGKDGVDGVDGKDGVDGAAGTPGPQGPIGPSDAYSDYQTTEVVLGLEPTKVLSKTVPPGNYVVMTTVRVVGGGAPYAVCSLWADSSLLLASTAGAPVMTRAVTLDTQRELNVKCQMNIETHLTGALSRSLVAIKVGAVN